MEKRIDLQTLIGTEIRSRTNADIIRTEINDCKDSCILDFKGVTFVSRSFADELCSIMDENRNVKLTNETTFVKKMIDTVLTSRKRVRQRNDHSDIVSFSNIDDLCDFMRTTL